MRGRLMLLCGALVTLAGAGCANPIGGHAVLPANLPDPTADTLSKVDPCSLVKADGLGALGLSEIGPDYAYDPTCLYQTASGQQLEISLSPAAELDTNPDSFGALRDTTIASAPAKERRHPSNQACTVYLETKRPTVVSIATSTVDGTQDESCKLVHSAAEQAVPVLRDRRYTPDTYDPSALPGGGDPCALLTGKQAGKLGLRKIGPDEYSPDTECAYKYRNGNQFTIGSQTKAGAASSPGKAVDTTVAGQPAQQKRQPYNTYCTIVLLPEEDNVVTVAVGGLPKFKQDNNCKLARAAARVVSGNLD